MEKVDFVQLGQITPAGQDVLEYMQRHIDESVQLYESSSDLNHINGMTGTLKHYYVNVMTAKTITPQQWLEDYDYGATAMWHNLQDERKAAEKEKAAQDQALKTDTLAAQLAKLEGQLTEALTAIKAKDQQIAALKEDDTADDTDEDEDDDTPAPKKQTRRSKKTQEQKVEDGPAETAAEEDAETEDESEDES